MLTYAMRDALLFIALYLDEHGGVSPTYKEIGKGLSKPDGSVHSAIIGLEQRGFVRRTPHCARALEVIRIMPPISPTTPPPPSRLHGATIPMQIAMHEAIKDGASMAEIWQAGCDAGRERR